MIGNDPVTVGIWQAVGALGGWSDVVVALLIIDEAVGPANLIGREMGGQAICPESAEDSGRRSGWPQP